MFEYVLYALMYVTAIATVIIGGSVITRGFEQVRLPWIILGSILLVLGMGYAVGAFAWWLVEEAA